jgi:hypothetical protein
MIGRPGVLALLLWTFLSTQAAFGQDVLLVHDAGSSPTQAERDRIAFTQDLLGHFTVNVSALAVQQYEPHSLSRYGAVIYLGLRPGVPLPSDFLSDCYDLDLPTCWLGANLDQLAARFSLGRYGFSLQQADPKTVFSRIEYRGMPFWRTEQPLRRIEITRPQVCETIAVARSGPTELPYAVRAQNFLYFAEVPIEMLREQGAHLILADQLHSFLSRPHETARTALLYVGPITPDTDAGELAELLRALRAEGAVCALEVSPLLAGEAPGEYLRLGRKRGLVGVLRGAQREGASIVVISPGPAEAGDEPVRPVSAKAAAERGQQFASNLKDVLGEALHCGLYPVALSVARHRLAAGEAATLAQTCSTVMARQHAGREDRRGAAIPFVVHADAHGQRVLPDNAPPLREGRGEVETMLEVARQQATVPDPWVAVRVSPGAPVASALLLIDGFRTMEFSFTDLRHSTNWVKEETVLLHTVGAQRLLTDLLPTGWGATLLGPDSGARQELAWSDREEIDSSILLPGTILVAYPPGELPRVVLSFEGDPQQVSNRVVHRISHVIVLLALIATAVLFLLYVFQAVQRRSAAGS